MRLAETRHTWVEWASSQLLQNTPLHPVAEWGAPASAAPHQIPRLSTRPNVCVRISRATAPIDLQPSRSRARERRGAYSMGRKSVCSAGNSATRKSTLV